MRCFIKTALPERACRRSLGRRGRLAYLWLDHLPAPQGELGLIIVIASPWREGSDASMRQARLKDRADHPRLSVDADKAPGYYHRRLEFREALPRDNPQANRRRETSR